MAPVNRYLVAVAVLHNRAPRGLRAGLDWWSVTVERPDGSRDPFVESLGHGQNAFELLRLQTGHPGEEPTALKLEPERWVGFKQPVLIWSWPSAIPEYVFPTSSAVPAAPQADQPGDT